MSLKISQYQRPRKPSLSVLEKHSWLQQDVVTASAASLTQRGSTEGSQTPMSSDLPK